MEACQNCGSYECEQEGDRYNMKIRCVKCGDVRFLESYRDEGQDKWRDERNRDDYR